MNRLYASPLRVYLLLGLLALVGIISGFKLPVSLFPNSSKPSIGIWVEYGGSTADEFQHNYGDTLESQVKGISDNEVEVEKITSSYEPNGAYYVVDFKWGTPARDALREVQTVVNSLSSTYPKEMRDGIGVWSRNENAGFLAVSLYSPSRSLDELFKIVEPVLMPRIAKVTDAVAPELHNPSGKEIRVELKPGTMAQFQLFPKDIERALYAALGTHSGGSITLGTQQLSVQMPRDIMAVEDLGQIPVPTPAGATIHLVDIARIDIGPTTTNTRSFKTNGNPSLILMASPKIGGNVKRMAEDILKIVEESKASLPKDIEYRTLVDPSEFIRNAVSNVFHEVLIGALLAVAVLFLFVGSFKNTVTAAIEIPLSMVLAFILMRAFNMNLNLISLGGLALSAGMNVDASVVVMENIFRHFESIPNDTRLGYQDKLKIVAKAVAEVRFPVIASTIASLVVFLPLAFTSDLTYAILGDLAKTVVFSHGFSAIVALVLVPTVRLQLMSRGGAQHSHSPIEGTLKRLEDAYARTLHFFILSPKLKYATYTGVVVALIGLILLGVPRLPKELIGTPDTDWMTLAVNTQGNTLLRQMETQSDEVEAQLWHDFGSKFQYTFTQVNSSNGAHIMARLKKKSDMREVWKQMESHFTNTPFLRFRVFPWNPSELPIPDPAQLRVTISGVDTARRNEVTAALLVDLQTSNAFKRVWSDPNADETKNIIMRPNQAQWSSLKAAGATFSPSDLADLVRVATTGRKIGELPVDGRLTNIMLIFPQGAVSTVEDLGALPIGVSGKLVPLKALSQIKLEAVPPLTYREDQHDLYVISGRNNAGEESLTGTSLKKAQETIEGFKKKRGLDNASKSGVTILIEDALKELHDALTQLSTAVALSVLLMLLTLVMQFGNVVNALLVLIAVPLGFIGVIVSLLVFRSTLSLNSVLGVILLNGIAVANSIILVDFIKQLVEQGHAPLDAAILAGRKRLRPILITSLTTILGMLPIALGLGDGGRILQPLGIAVSGGLWVSMSLTLLIVPALQVAYLERTAKKSRMKSVSLQFSVREQSGTSAQSELSELEELKYFRLQGLRRDAETAAAVGTVEESPTEGHR